MLFFLILIKFNINIIVILRYYSNSYFSNVVKMSRFYTCFVSFGAHTVVRGPLDPFASAPRRFAARRSARGLAAHGRRVSSSALGSIIGFFSSLLFSLFLFSFLSSLLPSFFPFFPLSFLVFSLSL